MSNDVVNLPENLPDYLKHSDLDTPVPGWEQVTCVIKGPDTEMIEHVSRIVSDTGDEQTARSVWESWPGNYRRSVALLVHKIYNEGWLGHVGPIIKWPWDGGFFFQPRKVGNATLAETLRSKSGRDGGYIESSWRNGLFAYLNSLNHKGWQNSWMETDDGAAALHIGIFTDGSAEVHMEVFNPLYINGAPSHDITSIPLLGSYNHKLFKLHQQWERSQYARFVRTSANLYHLMAGKVPLCF